MRRLLITIGIVFVIGAIVFLFVLPAFRMGRAQSSTVTTTIQRVSLNETIESTGVVSANRTAYLTFGTSGIVSNVDVLVGDTVQQGDVLASLDTLELELQVVLREAALATAQATYDQLVAEVSPRDLALAESNIASAEAQLINAQTAQTNAAEQITIACANRVALDNSLEAARTAYDDYLADGFARDVNFVPDANAEPVIALENVQASYDSADAQCNSARNSEANHNAAVASAEANLAFAQASLAALIDGASAEQIAITRGQLDQAMTQLALANAALDRARLVAPFEGVITAVNIEQGQSANLATTAITLMDISAYHLAVDVDELDVMHLEVGQSATVTLETLDGQTIPGTVSRIAPAANGDTQGVTTYSVRVDLMMDGQQANVQPQAISDVSASTIPQGNGQGGRLRQLLPVIESLGSIEGLNALAALPDGNEQFIAALHQANIDPTLILQIEVMGGLDALLDALNANEGLLSERLATAQTPTPQPLNDSVPPVMLRIGMTADVEIVVGELTNVFAVKSEAIQRNGSQEYLVGANGVSIPITTGISRDGLTVVYGDLSEGQVINLQNSTTEGAETVGSFRLRGLLGGG